ncbi:cytochrome P450 [Thelonectria olida]|uniref:Cytochrome P450 n=1 Tax=Thelonectria olida TaxID=1576542 RepID=A0A9P8VV99_9HYPO|nr:cytochrome P450 [Thelonectria olida]
MLERGCHHRATKRMSRYESGESLDDFFQALMHDKSGQAHNHDWGEIVAEVSITMNAGFDTTTVAMCNAWNYLFKDLVVFKTLREEADAVLDPDEVVAPYDKVKHLLYLRAVPDESLRLSPPPPPPQYGFGLPRRTPPEGCQVGNYCIPGHTSVSISAHVAHRYKFALPGQDREPERVDAMNTWRRTCQ